MQSSADVIKHALADFANAMPPMMELTAKICSELQSMATEGENPQIICLFMDVRRLLRDLSELHELVHVQYQHHSHEKLPHTSGVG